MAERQLLLLLWIVFASTASAQTRISRDPVHGFYVVDSANLQLTSDVPIDDELEAWPNLLAQAIQVWTNEFGEQASKLSRAQLKVYLIADRSKFESAGLLAGVPSFDEGYQLNNLLVIREQPTPYYRRHLFLHEATHWCYATLYGGCGPPWFMEGMADYFGTHLLKDKTLQLGVIPRSPGDFPNWGRFRLIAESLEQNDAPSLNQILDYPSDRDRLKRYAWSWAASTFFRHHPRYRNALNRVSTGPLDYSATLSKELKRELQPVWEQVLVDWNGFVSDFGFGYDLDRSLVSSQDTPTRKTEGKIQRFWLRTDRGWQSTGIMLASGESVKISCEGRFTIRATKGLGARPWQSEADGITIEYYRENPLGTVLATIQPPNSERTIPWKSYRIGQQGTISGGDAGPTGGLVFLKINESSDELFDNEGELSVTVSSLQP
jgi:hypothetical protein